MGETLLMEPLTETERRAFSQKLVDWARTLRPKEQEFLAAMLRAAGGGDEDTAGHALELPGLTPAQAKGVRYETLRNAIGRVW